VNPGRLRHRILVERRTGPELDSDGATIEGWEPVFSGLVSAEIVALSGRELIAAEAVQSKVSTRIRVRFHADYAANQRVTHRSTVYNIEAIVPDPKSGVHFAMLQCTSGVNEG
jgi:SPP1 family predicted phage head-tail adaptor